MLDGITLALAETDFEVVGETTRGTEILPLINRLHPDLVVLELRLSEMDGLFCLKLIHERHPDLKLVVLSEYTDATHVESAFAYGASAYIAKSIDPLELPAALHQALEETIKNVIGMRDTDRDVAGAAGLTKRERMVMRSVALGHPSRTIAEELWVTEKTVKFHLTNIYRKLGVTSRTEAAHAAYRLGIAENPSVGGEFD